MGKPAHWLISQPVTVEQTQEIWGGFTSGNLKKEKKIQQIHTKRCYDGLYDPPPVVMTSLDCLRCEIKCRGRSHLIQIVALLWVHSQNIPPPIVCHRDKQGLGKLWLSKSHGGAGSVPGVTSCRFNTPVNSCVALQYRFNDDRRETSATRRSDWAEGDMRARPDSEPVPGNVSRPS